MLFLLFNLIKATEKSKKVEYLNDTLFNFTPFPSFNSFIHSFIFFILFWFQLYFKLPIFCFSVFSVLYCIFNLLFKNNNTGFYKYYILNSVSFAINISNILLWILYNFLIFFDSSYSYMILPIFFSLPFPFLIYFILLYNKKNLKIVYLESHNFIRNIIFILLFSNIFIKTPGFLILQILFGTIFTNPAYIILAKVVESLVFVYISYRIYRYFFRLNGDNSLVVFNRKNVNLVHSFKETSSLSDIKTLESIGTNSNGIPAS